MWECHISTDNALLSLPRICFNITLTLLVDMLFFFIFMNINVCSGFTAGSFVAGIRDHSRIHVLAITRFDTVLM